MAAEVGSEADLHRMRKRLRYRAWHRGTREMDLILGPFADAELDDLGEAALLALERLLEEADTDLLAWVTGQTDIPEHVDAELMRKVVVRHHARAGS